MSDEFRQLQTEVIGELYDAALSQGSWPALLRAFSDALSRIGVVLVVRDLKAEKVGEGEGESEAPDDEKAGRQYHLAVKVDPSAARGGAGAGAETPEADTGAPPESLVLGCFVARDRPMGSLVAIRVTDREEWSGRWDSASLNLLAGHLRRGFELHNQFVTLNQQQAATKHVLDHFPVGVILVDSRARALTMNSSAKAILGQKDGLAIDRSGIYAESGDETAALRSLIERASGASDDHGRYMGGALTVTRPSMRRPLWILVAPLRSQSEAAAVPSMVALFVSDPDRRHEIPAQALERFFGLTPAETRLLEALVNGKSLEEASEEFKVSKNTLRTQLHQIFRKTDTSRQSEVIKLVLSTPVRLEQGELGSD